MVMVNTVKNNVKQKGEPMLSLFLYRRVFIVAIYSHYIKRLNNHAVTLP